MSSAADDKKAEKKRLADEKAAAKEQAKIEKERAKAEKEAAKKAEKAEKEAAKAAKEAAKKAAKKGGSASPPSSPSPPTPATTTAAAASAAASAAADVTSSSSAPVVSSSPVIAPSNNNNNNNNNNSTDGNESSSNHTDASNQADPTAAAAAVDVDTDVAAPSPLPRAKKEHGGGGGDDLPGPASSSRLGRGSRASFRTSFYGAPTLVVPGVVTLQRGSVAYGDGVATNPLATSGAGEPNSASELGSTGELPVPAAQDAIEVDVVEELADEQVGSMVAGDSSTAAAYLAAAIASLRGAMLELYAGGSNAGYVRAYQDMQAVGMSQPTTVSFLEPNKLKNRYGNIGAYDHSRVVLPELPDESHSDYINANYIGGFHRDKAYIASQGPVPNSFISFWRMVWQDKVDTICMVTNEVEMGKMKCHRYWPDPTSSPPAPVQQYGDIVVEHVRAVPHLHFIVREFLLSLNGETRRLKHFAYTSWPDHGVPLTTTELLGFRNAVKEAQGSTTAPLLIHCSAGVGRTGTYIAIDHIVEQCLNLGGTIDIDTVVRTMRMARNYMVQTEAQYIFIYRAVLDALCDLLSIETDKAVAANAAKLASVGEESTRAAMLADDQALRSAADAAAEEKRVQEEAEKAHIEAARIELLARVETSASSAALIVASSLSVKDRMQILNSQKDKWLLHYKQSLEEWNERFKFEAEVYDLTSTLTPIQSRMEALRQKGLVIG